MIHRFVLFGTSALVSILPLAPVSGQDAGTAKTPPPAAAEQPGAAELPEILITGSRIARNGYDLPTPTKVLGAAAIAERGLSNIGDFINEVPAFRPSSTNQTVTQVPISAGQTYADLRGLGSIRTLTLVNSRRFVPSAATGQVDLNLIPTILVNRIDVVTGGASAAYGSDAISGVVNIITDDHLQGFKGDISYGLTEYGDNRERHVGLAFGTSFNEDRGHITVGGEYVDSSGVGSYNDRDWGRDLPALVSVPGVRLPDQPSRFYARGVQSNNASFGGLIVGVNADTNAANGRDVLRGIDFGPGGTPTTYNYGTEVVGASAINFSGGTPGFFPQNGWQLITPIDRRVALLHLDYEATTWLNLFVEGNYGRSGTNSKSPPVRDVATTGPAAIIIRRDNPFLPASIAATMDANGITSFALGRANNDFGEVRTNNHSTTERGVGGFVADLGGSWKLDGYVEVARNEYDVNISNLRIEQNFFFAIDAVRNAAGQIVCRNAATAPTGCVPINVLGVGSPSQAAIDYVTGTTLYSVVTEQTTAALNLQGEVFSTWAGPVSVAVGGEYRRLGTRAVSDEISVARGFNYGNPQPFRGSFNVKEGYIETVVPLLKDSAIGKSLELNGAARRTEYSSSGGVTTWKVGGTYQPIDDIRLRATFSRDIRAPNASELFVSQSSFATLRNPFTGITTQLLVLNQPSPTLKPEKSDTKTFGVVLSPTFLPGFHLSVDYYDISIKGAIAAPPPQTVLDNCFAETAAGRPGTFCSFVDRSGTGTATAINSVNVQLLNLANLRSRGIDIDADYRFPLATGQMSLRVFGTYTKDLISDDGLGIPRTYNAAGVLQTVGSVVNRAGQVGGFGGTQISGATSAPHWIVNAAATFSIERFTGNITGRYVGGGHIDNTLVGPDDRDYNAASPISIANNNVAGRFYLNLTASYDVLKDDRRKLQIYGVVNNATNNDPPFPATAVQGFYDRIGRSFKLGARMSY